MVPRLVVLIPHSLPHLRHGPPEQTLPTQVVVHLRDRLLEDSRSLRPVVILGKGPAEVEQYGVLRGDKAHAILHPSTSATAAGR